jgi:epoxide hydrolase-like predicted phosphatase
MIKAIIFDCFGLFYVDSVRAFIEAQPRSIQTDLTDAVRAFDLEVMNEQDLIRHLSQRSGMPPEVVGQNLYSPEMVRNQALMEYAQGLRGKYKISLLTNLSPHTMDKYFTQEERAQYFDDVVVSSEVGLVKPQPEIYLLACKRLGVTPAEAVFIDDSSLNVQAATKLGMHGITYTNLAEMEQALTRILQNA